MRKPFDEDSLRLAHRHHHHHHHHHIIPYLALAGPRANPEVDPEEGVSESARREEEAHVHGAPRARRVA
jgi:hypothetical protein